MIRWLKETHRTTHVASHSGTDRTGKLGADGLKVGTRPSARRVDVTICDGITTSR